MSVVGMRARQFALSGVIGIVVWASSASAKAGVFDNLAGSWSGGGTLTLSSGERERLRCKSDYAVTGDSVRMSLTCASDSYKFNLQGNVSADEDGNMSGSWNEATRAVGGSVNGTVKGGQISARIGGSIAAFLTVSTSGSRQSISINSPGSTMTQSNISLSRTSR